MRESDHPSLRAVGRRGQFTLLLAAAFVLASFAGRAQAAGFQLAEQNASGLGNGYAGSAAVAEDASTIYFNPAGMTRLPGLNISAGATVISTNFRFSNDGSIGPGGLPLGSNTGGNAGSVSAIPNAYLSWQASPRWFVGVGVSAPFGLATKYDDEWVGRYQSTEFDIRTINVNPSVAYKVDERLSLGAGISWQRLDGVYRRMVPAYPAPDMKARIELGDNALGWNLGLMYQLTPATRVGASYRAAVHYDGTGTATLGNIPASKAAVVPARADSRASFTLPDSAIFSVVHDVNNKWQLLGDLSWTHWSKLPSLDIDNGPLGKDSLELEFRNTWRVALGASYQYVPAWKFKAGLAYDQSPVPSSSLRPTSLPDNDRVSVSIGTQYRLNPNTTVDVGYAHLFFHANINNATDPRKGTVKGDWQTSADLIGLQVSYRY